MTCVGFVGSYKDDAEKINGATCGYKNGTCGEKEEEEAPRIYDCADFKYKGRTGCEIVDFIWSFGKFSDTCPSFDKAKWSDGVPHERYLREEAEIRRVENIQWKRERKYSANAEWKAYADAFTVYKNESPRTQESLAAKTEARRVFDNHPSILAVKEKATRDVQAAHDKYKKESARLAGLVSSFSYGEKISGKQLRVQITKELKDGLEGDKAPVLSSYYPQYDDKAE